jgi:hypothetical protein
MTEQGYGYFKTSSQIFVNGVSTAAARYGYGTKTSGAEVPVHNANIPSAEINVGNPPGSNLGLPAGYPTAAGPVYRDGAEECKSKTDFGPNDIRSQNPNHQSERR